LLIDRYCDELDVAGTYENQILYRVCLRDAPGHCHIKQTMGKLIAVGRIYAASPERGAGPAEARPKFWESLAEKLKAEDLDARLEVFDHAARFDVKMLKNVVFCHHGLVEWLYSATKELNPKVNPRRHPSFASKYLHFHRPNTFPIMDSFATAGLFHKAGPVSYQRFCNELIRAELYVGKKTLREIDSDLVIAGRDVLNANPKSKSTKE
jgi:hypothetical protein